MYVPARGPRWEAVRHEIWTILVAGVSIVRGLFLLLSGRPGTPLRALCVAAFDALHMLRLPPSTEADRCAHCADVPEVLDRDGAEKTTPMLPARNQKAAVEQ